MSAPKPEQVTMFGLLDGYETPQLAVKYRNQGVKAWVIEAAAWKESLKPDAPILYWGVRARRVEFIENAKPDKLAYSGWFTAAESCDGMAHFGWYGGLGHEPVFEERPTFADMEKYVKRRRGYREGVEIRPW